MGSNGAGVCVPRGLGLGLHFSDSVFSRASALGPAFRGLVFVRGGVFESSLVLLLSSGVQSLWESAGERTGFPYHVMRESAAVHRRLSGCFCTAASSPGRRRRARDAHNAVKASRALAPLPAWKWTMHGPSLGARLVRWWAHTRCSRATILSTDRTLLVLLF